MRIGQFKAVSLPKVVEMLFQHKTMNVTEIYERLTSPAAVGLSAKKDALPTDFVIHFAGEAW
jgi:hypothetical protein